MEQASEKYASENYDSSHLDIDDHFKAGYEYATQEKQGWVKLTDQHIEGNPLMLFDDGSVCYFDDTWPRAVATHYMPDAPQKPEV